MGNKEGERRLGKGLAKKGSLARGGGVGEGAWQLALQFSLGETKEKAVMKFENCNSGKGQRAAE